MPGAAETADGAALGLLERAGELDAVAVLIGGASEGRGGCLLIEASPGLGKSSLLEYANALARRQGHRVLRARGHQLEQAFAWGVARTLFDGWSVARRSTAREADTPAGPAASALRMLNLSPGCEDTPANEAAFAILHGLYCLAVSLAEQSPLLVVVDDAHWVDGPSLRWLLYLVGRVPNRRIALLLAARTGHNGEDGLLAQLAADPQMTVRRLEPLGATAVADLVRRRRPRADDRFCRRCVELTGGNPLHLRELLTALETQPDGPDAEVLAAGAALAARSLARSVQRRLAALPEPARQLARAVAVFEGGVSLQLAATLAAVDPETALVAADELSRVDLLRPGGDPLEFIHPLVCAAIYGELPRRRRAEIHRKAAALLASEGASDEQVSAHLLESPPAGDEDVVATLKEAARRAFAQGASSCAMRYLERALREPPSAQTLPGVLAELSRAEGAIGRAEAVDHLQAAIDRENDPRARAVMLLDLGRLLHDRGRLNDACAACLQGRDELVRAGIDHQATELVLNLEAGYLTSAMLSPEYAAQAYRRVSALLSRPGRSDTPADRALTSKAMVMQLFAGGQCAQLLPLAQELFGGGRLVTEGGADSQALWHTMGVLSYCDDYATADQAFRLGIEDAHRRGSVIAVAGVSMMRARRALWTGPVADAEEAARSAFDVWYPTGHMYVSAAGVSLVSALLERDEVDQADVVLRMIEERPTAFGMFAGWRLAASGRLAARRGQDAHALRDFLACGRHLAEAAVLNPVALSWRSEAGLAALRLGRRDQAESLIAEEVRLAEQFGAPRALGVARRAAGLSARGEDAVTLLRSAADLHAGCGAHLEQARTLVCLGAAIRRSGRPSDARAVLRDALMLADPLGAIFLAQQARTELLKAGGRPPAGRATARLLTPSEQRVAEMAAAGRSNQQIADALFITVKAVEWHLSNTYRKLGIRGRYELAEAMTSTAG